jgi:hypothetical protein
MEALCLQVARFGASLHRTYVVGRDNFFLHSKDHEFCWLDGCDPDHADESPGIHIRSCHRGLVAFHKKSRFLGVALQCAR